MNYANPAFPYSNTANVNAAPVAVAKAKSYAPAGQQHAGYPGHCGGYGMFSTTGSILVLFILLVIITRAWVF